MILLTNSDNGELAFRPLLETILGNTVTPWEWEGYTPGLHRGEAASKARTSWLPPRSYPHLPSQNQLLDNP